MTADYLERCCSLRDDQSQNALCLLLFYCPVISFRESSFFSQPMKFVLRRIRDEQGWKFLAEVLCRVLGMQVQEYALDRDTVKEKSCGLSKRRKLHRTTQSSA